MEIASQCKISSLNYKNMKHWILGVDEAGYGPNLGPFVVTGTLWEIPENRFNDAYNDHLILQECLKDVVTDRPRLLQDGSREIVIGDSKKIYTASKSLDDLERTVRHCLAILGYFPRDWRELLDILAPDDLESVLSCYDPDTLPLIWERQSSFSDCFKKYEVNLKSVKSRMITPKVFNQFLDQLENKSHLLTEVTMHLVERMLREVPEGQVTVVCDKHGGRNRYLDILYHWFPDQIIEVVIEGREVSIYRFGSDSHRMEFQFRCKGDELIPTGLASIVSKFLREISMKIFNDFWIKKIPGLKPTAGYPLDAVRFYEQIREKAKSLNIPQSFLWRNK